MTTSNHFIANSKQLNQRIDTYCEKVDKEVIAMAKIKVLEATESMQRLQAQLDEESSDDEAYQMTEQEDSVSHSQHVSPPQAENPHRIFTTALPMRSKSLNSITTYENKF